MIYDFLIVGGGVAGAICAYQLSKSEKKCLVLEKKSKGSEKICGGGISNRALSLLETIGMDLSELYEYDNKRILGHIIFSGDTDVKKNYLPTQTALGVQRCIFDGYLLQQAMSVGASIHYEQNVERITYTDDVYSVNGYKAKNIIWATGARDIQNKLLKEQSIGYSGQICTDCALDDDKFYFWYYDEKGKDRYFWAFPIGENLWNVGVWFREYANEIRRDFEKCLNDIFLKYVENTWCYKRLPKAEFLGHVDQRKNDLIFKYGIGDFSGTCNVKNGGGIHCAIESAIDFCENIDKIL